MEATDEIRASDYSRLKSSSVFYEENFETEFVFFHLVDCTKIKISKRVSKQKDAEKISLQKFRKKIGKTVINSGQKFKPRSSKGAGRHSGRTHRENFQV